MTDSSGDAGSPRLGDLKAGDRVGDYVIREKLGQGGMGEVFRAEQPDIKARVAIKVLTRQMASTPDASHRLRQEAIAVNLIDHPNIVRIFNFGQLPDGRHYFVMELLDGLSLAEVLQARGTLPPAEALPILREVARALDAAHDAGFIHRDIKPENIFLCYDESRAPRIVKLLDFGIAKLVDSETGENPLSRTTTSIIIGSPVYMSPEQCQSKMPDRRSDIYSLGVVAYEMLTGELPFYGDTPFELMSGHVSGEATLPSQLRPQLPTTFDAPMLRALHKSPDARFQRATELATALELALRQAIETGSMPQAAPRDTTSPLPPPWEEEEPSEQLELETRPASGLAATATWPAGARGAHGSRQPRETWSAANAARTGAPSSAGATSHPTTQVSPRSNVGMPHAARPAASLTSPSTGATGSRTRPASSSSPSSELVTRPPNPWYIFAIALAFWTVASALLDWALLAGFRRLLTVEGFESLARAVLAEPLVRRIGVALIALWPTVSIHRWLADTLNPVPSYMAEARCPSCGWRGQVSRHRPVCSQCAAAISPERLGAP